MTDRTCYHDEPDTPAPTRECDDCGGEMDYWPEERDTGMRERYACEECGRVEAV